MLHRALAFLLVSLLVSVAHGAEERTVAAEERQVSFALVTMFAVGMRGTPGAFGTGPSFAYRYATPRWAFAGVVEGTTGPAGPEGQHAGELLHGSVGLGLRRFLSPGDTALFLGGGAGLLGIVQRWSLPEHQDDPSRYTIGSSSDKSTRSLATAAPFVEFGLVAGRSRVAQADLSLRVDVPLERMDGGGELPMRTPGEAPVARPAVYVLPISLRAGVQF